MSALDLVISGFHDVFHAPVWDALSARAQHIEAIVGDERPRVACALVPHRYSDLALSADYRVPPSTLRPLDAEIVDSYASTEVQFLRMADRLELLGAAPYHERKTLYLAHLRYWVHRLTTRRPDAALFSNVPHEMHDFVLYEVCRRERIPTLVFTQTQIEDTFLSFEDWRDPLPGARAQLEAMDKPVLSGRFLRHFEVQSSQACDPVPFYMHAVERTLLTRLQEGAALALRPGVVLNRALMRARQAPLELATRRVRAVYDKIARVPRLDVPYVYVALHYQPEMTTSPSAGAFVDQSLIVEMISAAVGPGVHVYVKEHPKQTAVARGAGEYGRWATLPNVTLVSRATSTYALIDGAIAVATCTGTVGWEALFRERPVLMFGSYFYQYADGVHRVRTRADLDAALEVIRAGRGRPTLASTAKLLQLLDERSHEGYVDPAYRQVSHLDDATSVAAIVRATSTWLDRLSP